MSAWTASFRERAGSGCCAGEGGCIACDGNGEDEYVSDCSHAADGRRGMAGKKDGLGSVEMEEAVLTQRLRQVAGFAKLAT